MLIRLLWFLLVAVALVEPLSTKPRVDLLLYVSGCLSVIEELDIQKSLTFCYNRSLACTRIRCWAKRLPDNNCSSLSKGLLE